MYNYKLKIRLAQSSLVKTFELSANSITDAIKQVAAQDKIVAITRLRKSA